MTELQASGGGGGYLRARGIIFIKKKERSVKPFLSLQVTYVGICGIRREGLAFGEYSHIMGAGL